MPTSLFKMPFDTNAIRLERIYAGKGLEQCSADTMSCDKIRAVYGGDLRFMELHDDRPCTYTSLVTSIDGRIAFSDAPQGPLIARLNREDPDGAGADWWMLNMLRSLSDAVMLGAGTMNAESDYTCHVFDQDLEDMRAAAGVRLVPWNVITSLDATDIPFDHILFRTPEVPVMISTSVEGLAAVRENIQNEYFAVSAATADDVTDDMIAQMKAHQDRVLVIATGGKTPDSKAALLILKRFGIDRMLVETPSYMHYLVSQRMMDELFFSYSCIYVGGRALTIGQFGKEFGSQDHPHTRMLSIHAHSDHFFYFRQKLIYG